MCGFLGKVNPESTSDSIVRLLWWQVLKIGFINFLGLHRKWVVLVRFCPVRTRTLSVTQKLRRLIAFTVWLPGQRWWDVGPVAALPHTLREGWGPDPPPPRWIRVTSETTTEMRKLHHKERFLSLFLQCLLKLCLFSLCFCFRAGVRGVGSVRCSASAGPRAWLLRSLWGLPESGIEPVSPAPTGGFFTTDPPGKP